MQTDGQTDMTKLIFTYRDFANAPKDEEVIACTVFLVVKH